jgi:hypothetical protein
MAFTDDIARYTDQIRGRLDHVKGEEATKQALVIPFLQVLGYDVFDPREVRPEYVADFATKKSGQFEKVDYAVFMAGSPAFFVECKPLGAPLEDHGGQLARYFNATPSVRIAMITDGVKIMVYTDLNHTNVMDPTPWLNINLLALKPAEIEVLRRFRKADFSAEETHALAEEMVYYSAMTDLVGTQFQAPTDSFVRWAAGELPSVGRVTDKLIKRLTPILKKAMQSVLVDQVTRSLERTEEPVTAPVMPLIPEESKSAVITTPEELEVYKSIKDIILQEHPDATIGYNDTKSYFTIHQGRITSWFARFGIKNDLPWLALRHVKVNEAKLLSEGVECVEEIHYGDCKFILGSVADIQKTKVAVLSAYNREIVRE